MEFTPNEEPGPERGNSTEIATQEDLERLTSLAELLLEHGSTNYASESVRRNVNGSLILQTAVVESGDNNYQSSTIIVTDENDQLAEFYFIESTDFPVISIYMDKIERAREVLISLIMEGKLDKTETAIALFCIRHFAAEIEGYAHKEEDRINYLDLISDQVNVRNKDFVGIRSYNNENDIDEYEISIATISQSNPRRNSTEPKMQIILDDQTTDYQISLIQKPDGTFVVVENDLYELGIDEELVPETYHIKKLKAAIVKELSQRGVSCNTPALKVEDIPYLDLVQVAIKAYTKHQTAQDEEKQNFANIYDRAMELLRRDFESRYHLIGPGENEPSSSQVNVPNLPRLILGEIFTNRNMLIVKTPVLFINEESGTYSQIDVDDTKSVTVEYSHLEEFRMTYEIEGESSIFDIFLVSKPNRFTNGKSIIIPLSQMTVVQFAPLNN